MPSSNYNFNLRCFHLAAGLGRFLEGSDCTFFVGSSQLDFSERLFTLLGSRCLSFHRISTNTHIHMQYIHI